MLPNTCRQEGCSLVVSGNSLGELYKRTEVHVGTWNSVAACNVDWFDAMLPDRSLKQLALGDKLVESVAVLDQLGPLRATIGSSLVKIFLQDGIPVPVLSLVGSEDLPSSAHFVNSVMSRFLEQNVVAALTVLKNVDVDGVESDHAVNDDIVFVSSAANTANGLLHMGVVLVLRFAQQWGEEEHVFAVLKVAIGNR